MTPGVLRGINPIAECKKLNWPIWQCPPFLFILLGIITIISMVITYVFASNLVEEPEMAAIIVILVTVFFLIVGNFIINGFNRIAEANRMKSEFISIISHQLRSPLSIFKWTLDVIQRDTKNGNHQNLNDFLKTFHDATESMIRLVNSLLEVSRIEARTLILRREKISLVELTRRVLEDIKTYIETSKTKIEFEPEADLPEIWADRDRMLIIIHNLIDNAIRYSKEGGVIIITVKKPGPSLTWQIQDQGIGIPTSQQKYIFQKFFRALNGSRFHTEGTGIGLYIAKELIEALGGEISFKSEEGKGSTFWFNMPLGGKAQQKL